MPRSICLHPDHKPAIAQALERNGFLTQGDLAAHLEIALSTVSNFCRGVKVSIAKFEAIAEALGLDAKALVLPDQVTTDPSISREPMVSQAPALDFYSYDEAWVGREEVVDQLVCQVRGACRILLITGIAGVGKTALAERLSLELRDMDMLRENFDAKDRTPEFGSFAARLLEKLGQVVTPADRLETQQLLTRLVEALRDRPHLLIVDSLEEVLQGNEQEGWSDFIDDGFLLFFQQVLAAESFNSRLVITSQELPAPVLDFGTRYRNYWLVQPLMGLSPTEQLALFAKTGLDVDLEARGRPLLERIGRAYEGHPLALRVIVGEMGSRPFFGDVLAYWNRYGYEIETVEQALAEAEAGQVMGAEDRWRLDRFTRELRRNVRLRLEQTFQRLQRDARFAYILLCETSVYRTAVPEEWWLSHLEYWDCDEEAAAIALDVLHDRFLVEETLDAGQYGLRQHNLIRSVSLDHLHRLGEADEI